MTENVFWVPRLMLNDGREAASQAPIPELVQDTMKENGALKDEWHRVGDKVDNYLHYTGDGDAGFYHRSFGTGLEEPFVTAFTANRPDVFGASGGAMLDGPNAAGAHFLSPVSGFAK